MSPQYGELAEIGSGVWGTPANFNRFRVLAALLHGTLVVGISQTLQRWTEGATCICQGGCLQFSRMAFINMVFTWTFNLWAGVFTMDIITTSKWTLFPIWPFYRWHFFPLGRNYCGHFYLWTFLQWTFWPDTISYTHTVCHIGWMFLLINVSADIVWVTPLRTILVSSP